MIQSSRGRWIEDPVAVAEQRLRKLRNRLTAVVKDNPELLSADTEKTEEEEDIVGRSELSPLRLQSRLRRFRCSPRQL
ncbi:hypothetical protein F2Q69_00053593 [Brassica cretica]|uniref:Uncharacterized protein n=1 Tax=Brassica cretica TaxID=69181 RepID=A0A8S9NC44_BRACR|nr:hypothetical protein F2Q69_00053593 [Brassica cretica]